MAFRRSRKRTFRRKARRRYKARPRRSIGMANFIKSQSSDSPFPNKLPFRLEYADMIRYNAVFASHQWQMNSIYDPDKTGGGHQPLGRDNYAAIYNNYTVTGFRYKITIMPTSSEQIMYCVMPQGTNAAGPSDSAGLYTAIERSKMTRWGFIAPQSVASKPTTLRGKVKIRDILGQTKTKFIGDDNNSAGFGSDPVNNPYFNITLCSSDFTATMTADVVIEFVFYGYAWRPNTLTTQQ